MSTEYISLRRRENIRPVVLENKSKYYRGLAIIEHSWSGRLDIWGLGNAFIMEAAQLLVNAIELFEMGYFDCAYYSLRSAVETSTTIVYLSDMPDRDALISRWKGAGRFPSQSDIVKSLAERSASFADMRNKMAAFFRKYREVDARLNKYVHKQGLRHFYVSRNHQLSSKSQEAFVRSFESYLKACIGIVAVMRLAIDPFPVLLMDEEILYRCFDSLTEPYSEEFVEEYIGADTIAAYKKTVLYTSAYEAFIKLEKKPPAVFEVTNNQYISTASMDELMDHLRLMTPMDVIAVLLVAVCPKATRVYCHNGLHMYFTDRPSKRDYRGFDSRDFVRLAEARDKINQSYYDAYISVFHIGGENYFVEHDDPLDHEEIIRIDKVADISETVE
jgi:hypothetical protein